MKKNVVQIFSGSFGIKKAPIYWCFSERRRGDLNPRAGTTGLLVFEARPFSHLGTPPN